MKLNSLPRFVRHWKLIAGIIIILIAPSLAVLFQPPESCTTVQSPIAVNMPYIFMASGILLGLCLIWLDVPHGESK